VHGPGGSLENVPLVALGLHPDQRGPWIQVADEIVEPGRAHSDAGSLTFAEEPLFLEHLHAVVTGIVG